MFNIYLKFNSKSNIELVPALSSTRNLWHLFPRTTQVYISTDPAIVLDLSSAPFAGLLDDTRCTNSRALISVYRL
jgi:hypothetical protein